MITHAESHHGQRLLTKKEVARHLGVSIRTVNNLVDRGQLPKPIVYSRQTIRWRPVLRVNLDERSATIKMRIVSRLGDDAAYLIVAGRAYAGG